MTDGFKRGTNYNHRMNRADYDPRAELAAAYSLVADKNAKCAAGKHDERVAEPGYATYMAFGRRIEPGTRYCRWCSAILGADPDPTPETAGEKG